MTHHPALFAVLFIFATYHCRSQVATSVASLPEADVKDEKVEGETECESADPSTTSSSPYCSACTSSAASSVSMATHYCKQCDQLFCEEHLKVSLFYCFFILIIISCV